MPKTRELTLHERSSIVALRNEGKSLIDLARQFKVHHTTIIRICAKFNQTGSVQNLKRSGPYRKTTERQDRSLKRIQIQQPNLVSNSVAQIFNAQHDVQINARTVRRRLVNMGLPSRIAKTKPSISAVNKRKRLDWARRHADWMPEQWQNVHFSDEVPISLVQNSQRRYIRCHASQVLAPGMTRPKIHSGGGKMMFWGSFCNETLGNITEINERLNGHGYKQLLEQHLNFREIIRTNKIFQHDNAPIHKAQCVTRWFEETALRVLDWPPQSPDLNPIENVWSHIKAKLDQHQISSKAMMRTEIQRIWQEIPPEYLHGLIQSMPRRIAAVIANKGGATNY